MRNKKSILFVRPDYHCSFFLRDEFRRLGWKADIFVDAGYPDDFLFSDQDILVAPKLGSKYKFISLINHLLAFFYYLIKFLKYSHHLYYGPPPAFNTLDDRLSGRRFSIELLLTRIFRIKLIYLPTGCRDFNSKTEFMRFDNGNVCNNCGTWNRCQDEISNNIIRRVKKYFAITIWSGVPESIQLPLTHLKYKSIDLKLWAPNLKLEKHQKLPSTDKIRILHSSALDKSGRNWQKRNIKGSPFVIAAIERLQQEGYQVEHFHIQDKPSKQMRFYQAQADIVVEQLIYGWWGSTGVETMALGKPVVCYLRPTWKRFFLEETFPEYDSLPIVEANTETIYDALKKLVIDPEYRRRKGEESRRFAEAHFDPKKNAKAFAKLLENI